MEGDFFYGAEFEYASKNGRDLRHTYDHDVALNADGSARITTTVIIRNTGDPGRFNESSLSYVSIYGPQGAVVDEEAGDPHIDEPEIAGHPAAGWFRQAPPGGETSVTVTWEAPAIARQLDDDTWVYSLTWMRVPDHTGDVLNLTGRPPGTTAKLSGLIEAQLALLGSTHSRAVARLSTISSDPRKRHQHDDRHVDAQRDAAISEFERSGAAPDVCCGLPTGVSACRDGDPPADDQLTAPAENSWARNGDALHGTVRSL